LVRLRLLYRSVLKNIVEILEEKDVKNAHYIQL
jgi:hypothetical protein